MNPIIYLGFGDSWAYGDELDLSREFPYIAVLAKHRGSTYSNYARPGTSLPQLVIQLRKFLKENHNPANRYCAVFFLTAKERSFVYHQQVDQAFNPRGIFPPDPVADELTKMNDLYYKYFYSDESADYQANVTLLVLQSLCRQYNIQDYYLPGWQNNTFWPEVDRARIYHTTCQELLNLEMDRHGCALKNNPYFTPNISHPNQMGHEKIANALHNWISNN